MDLGIEAGIYWGKIPIIYPLKGLSLVSGTMCPLDVVLSDTTKRRFEIKRSFHHDLPC
jgi:hypothetical protein